MSDDIEGIYSDDVVSPRAPRRWKIGIVIVCSLIVICTVVVLGYFLSQQSKSAREITAIVDDALPYLNGSNPSELNAAAMRAAAYTDAASDPNLIYIVTVNALYRKDIQTVEEGVDSLADKGDMIPALRSVIEKGNAPSVEMIKQRLEQERSGTSIITQGMGG